MEGYQWGGEGEEWRGKVQGNRKRNWKVQNRWGEDKNGIGNGEAKDFICMTHRHELRWGGMLMGGVVQAERNKEEKKMGKL